MRLLLVEDDALLGDGICTALRQNGDTVDWIRDGQHALAALCHHEFDAVILDLGLPKLDGLEVLKRFRRRGGATPILVLTARDTLEERVLGLDSGADDYLLKPFDLLELQARLRAITRRRTGRASPEIRHGALLIQPDTRTVSYHQQPVKLSRREYGLLYELVTHAGQVLSRSRLEQLLYGWDEDVESNALEVHIHHLRKKLATDLIKTIRGVGYLIEKPKP